LLLAVEIGGKEIAVGLLTGNFRFYLMKSNNSESLLIGQQPQEFCCFEKGG